MLGCSLLVLVDELFFTHLLLALSILLALGALLRSCFLYLLLHLRNLGTRQDGADAVIHLIDHIVPNLGTLQLEDQQRIFLLVGCILYRVFQLVELTQVLLPRIIDDMQEDSFLKFLDDSLRLTFVCLFQVAGDIKHSATISQRNHNALKPVTLSLIDLFDDRVSHSLDSFCLSIEITNGSLESILRQHLSRLIDELIVGEWCLHRQDVQEFLFASLIIVVLDDVDHAVPDDVGNIHTDTLSHQGMTTLLVDNSTLLVHHIVIFNQSLTDTEVVLLNLLLGTLNTLGNHRTLNHLTILETKLVHHIGNTLRGKQTHQLILE